MKYKPVHQLEADTLIESPNLAKDDVSECLPSWVEFFCSRAALNCEVKLPAAQVRAICHTLIAARKRQHRLIAERDEPIYAVWANHLERESLLGYCTAETEEDIQAFYQERAAYGLRVERVVPIHILEGYSERKNSLLQQRAALQAQIDELDKQIRG